MKNALISILWPSKNYSQERIRESRLLPGTFLDINEDKIKLLAAQGLKKWFSWVIGILASIATIFIVRQSFLTNNSMQYANQLIEKYQKVEAVDDRLEAIERKLDNIIIFYQHDTKSFLEING